MDWRIQNFVMDVDFGAIVDPAALATRLCGIPGLVEHEIFDNLDELYIARKGEVEIIRRKD